MSEEVKDTQAELALLDERLAILKVRRELLDLKEVFLMGHLAEIHELMAHETQRLLDLENSPNQQEHCL